MLVLDLVAKSAAVHAGNVRVLLLILVLIAVVLLLIGMAIALITWRSMRKM